MQKLNRTLLSKIRSKNASSQHVAQTILKDVSLTNRVLRIANSAYYKGLGGPVTTISRAVVMLGMNAILNMASALTIFEHFLKGSDTDELKNQVLQAILTALYAREIADKIKSINSEEPFICGMLHHLGILIVSFYFPEEQKAINSLMLDEKMDKEKASRKIMRLSYTDLSQAVSDSWGLPELIKNGIIRMNPDRKGPLKDKIETMQCITSYAYELSHAAMITDTSKRIYFARLARRFEDKISITPEDLEIITNNSLQLIPGGNTAIDIQEAFNEAENLPTFNKKNITSPTDTRNAAIQSNHAANNNSVIAEQLEFLSKTITDITTTITGTFSISDVIMMVLEGMSRGLGMQHVLLSMVTPQRDRLSFSCGLGPATDHLRTIFDFPMTSSSDAPVVCIKNRQEIFISDFETDRQSPLIPEALVHLLHPQSIVFLPVLMQNTAIGLVMATRSKEQMPINNLELQSMRMLVNQFVLAIHQSRTKK